MEAILAVLSAEVARLGAHSYMDTPRKNTTSVGVAILRNLCDTCDTVGGIAALFSCFLLGPRLRN